jgi:hypothetical protein
MCGIYGALNSGGGRLTEDLLQAFYDRLCAPALVPTAAKGRLARKD